MFIKSKLLCYFTALILIFPAVAFAWGEGYSTFSASSSYNTGTSTTIAPTSSSLYSVSSYSSSESASYSTTQTFTIPNSFQTIISKFDISQAVVPSEATIQQGLQQAWDFSDKNPLEGNEYKAAIIQPIMNLLINGNYSSTTRNKAFSNLLSIASNQRIDYDQKSAMVSPLIQYLGKEVTAVQSGTMDVETAKKELSTINDIFREVLKDKGITAEEQKNILVSITDDKILYQDSSVKNDILSIMSNVYDVLVADIDYPLSIMDNSNKDRGKLALAHELESALSTNSNSGFNSNSVSSLNALLKDTNLNFKEVKIIKDKTTFVLENRTAQDYSLKTICLSTLMNLATDTRLTEAERNEVKDLIATYGLNDYNRTVYKDTGVLLLAEDNSYYTSKTAGILTSTLENIPQDKRAKTILLDKQLVSTGQTASFLKSYSLIGTYSPTDDIISIQMGVDWYTAANYISTLYHEITHYIENNLMTTEQRSSLESIWKEANGMNDFVKELGATKRTEYLATTAEAVLMEHNSAQKPLLERAEKQDAANDPTLLKMYYFVEDLWGLS